jgi:hypothetical protein
MSVFTSPSRKRPTLTNNNSILNFGRRTRRFSVPAKQFLDVPGDNAQLPAAKEVSEMGFILKCLPHVLCYIICMLLILHEINFEC